MMQLVCNGSRLDLYENTDLQFTEENPLFAFDSIKCERTTNFKLPATPANDRAFALARIPVYAGEGMRRKFAAQLQLGTIVKDGYLYVSSWSGKEYEAIFVTGEMVGLQAIKDAGKIAEYYRPNNTLIWDVSQIKDANTAAGQTIWALTRYLCGNANLILPSADLADIISNAYFAVTQRQLTGLQHGWRLIPNELNGIPTSSLEVHYEGTGNSPGTLETNPADANRMSTTLAPLVRFINTTLVMYDGQLNDRFWRVQQLVAGQTLRLTFPADFSSDYFLIGIRDLGTQGTDPLYSPFSTEWFLGGYYFSPNLNTNTNVTYGTPLAGKTVEIPAGTPFLFVKKNWITWIPNTQGSAGVIYGFTQLANVGNVYTLTIQADGNDLASGNVVRLADNLPELTLIELLKIYAYLTGTQLYYNGQDIEFDDLFFISWKRFDISKQLLSIGEVTRTFADYAQRNIVGFDSADDVLYSQRITAEYDINNDNIEANKEIGKIPYSEGQIGIANNEQVAQFDMEESYGKKMQKSGIMEAHGIAPEGNTYGIRVTLPTNAGIQALCDASTQVEVQARMSAYEYAQITAKTRILCRGTEYVWTSRQWQRDTAKFVLAKLPPLNYYGLTAEARAEIESAYGFDVLVQVYRYIAGLPAVVPFVNGDPHLVSSLVETGTERWMEGVASLNTGISFNNFTFEINIKARLSSLIWCVALGSSDANFKPLGVTTWGGAGNTLCLYIDGVGTLLNSPISTNSRYKISCNDNGVYSMSKDGTITTATRNKVTRQSATALIGLSAGSGLGGNLFLFGDYTLQGIRFLPCGHNNVYGWLRIDGQSVQFFPPDTGTYTRILEEPK